MKIILAAVLLSGCATPDPFRKNVESLIDCEYKFVSEGDGLTCEQIMTLQAGCYSLYQMRKRRT